MIVVEDLICQRRCYVIEWVCPHNIRRHLSGNTSTLPEDLNLQLHSHMFCLGILLVMQHCEGGWTVIYTDWFCLFVNMVSKWMSGSSEDPDVYSDCCYSGPNPGESGQGLRPLWGLLPVCMWWLDQPASGPWIADLVGPISNIAGKTAGTVERCVATAGEFWYFPNVTRVGTLIVATIYLQLIQNRYMFRSFTVLHCSHQHCVQPIASDVEVVGYI